MTFQPNSVTIDSVTIGIIEPCARGRLCKATPPLPVAEIAIRPTPAYHSPVTHPTSARPTQPVHYKKQRNDRELNGQHEHAEC